jgi:hypothetical protein
LPCENPCRMMTIGSCIPSLSCPVMLAHPPKPDLRVFACMELDFGTVALLLFEQ